MSDAERPLSQFEGLVTIVLTLLGWSSVPLFLRHFAESIDAWTSNGWRYGFSALLWLPVLLETHRRGRAPRGLWRAAIVPSLVNAAGQVCFTWAHYRIDPGLLTFGLRAQLVFVAVGAYLLFPIERPVIRHPGYIVGGIVLLAGVSGTMLGGGALASTVRTEGIVLALFAGLLFAAYGLAVRRYMSGFRPVLAFATICQYTGGAMALLMLVLGDRAGAAALDLDGGQFALLLLSAIIGIALGHVFYYTALARLGVAVTAGVLQLQPFFVSIGSLFLFHERLNAIQWTCGTIAVCGAMSMLWVQRRVASRAR